MDKFGKIQKFVGSLEEESIIENVKVEPSDVYGGANIYGCTNTSGCGGVSNWINCTNSSGC
jgi:hypothetical protein